MEDYQVNHIKKNIDRLVNLTTCNVSIITPLQARDILSKAEAQRIDVKSKNEGELAAAHTFYDIVTMKKNSYGILVEVLKGACLTGAVSILEEIPIPASNTQSSGGTEKEKSKKDLRSMTVGTEGCDVHINRILEIARKSDTTLVMLQKEWKNIGMNLNIPLSDRDTWSTEILLGLKSVMDIFARLLTQWSSKEGEEATLGKLMDATKSCNMKAFSDEMEKAFL